jgi:hypothetical protein
MGTVGRLVVLAMGLGASACSEGRDPAPLPAKVAVEVPGDAGAATADPGAEPDAEPGAEPIKAYQATVVMVGDCGVGVVRVASDYADVDTFVNGVAQSSQRFLRERQLVVTCGALHRVVGFSFGEGEMVPGSAGRALLLDANPAAGVTLKPGSLVLTLDGWVRGVGAAQATLKGLSISMQAGRPMARFRISLRDGSEQGGFGGPGDLVDIAAAHHRIVDVAPPDMARGIPGWVEIEGTATE